MVEQTYHQNDSYNSLQESGQEEEYDNHKIEDLEKDEESKGSLNDLFIESQDHMQAQSHPDQIHDNED